jgi:hypothetical protein
MEWMEKSNPFARSVDLYFLTRIPKGIKVLVAKMEDLWILSVALMEEREWKLHLPPKVEGDYL